MLKIHMIRSRMSLTNKFGIVVVVVIYYLKLSLEALMPSGLVTLVLVNCFHSMGSAFEIKAFDKF